MPVGGARNGAGIIDPGYSKNKSDPPRRGAFELNYAAKPLKDQSCAIIVSAASNVIVPSERADTGFEFSAVAPVGYLCLACLKNGCVAAFMDHHGEIFARRDDDFAL